MNKNNDENTQNKPASINNFMIMVIMMIFVIVIGLLISTACSNHSREPYIGKCELCYKEKEIRLYACYYIKGYNDIGNPIKDCKYYDSCEECARKLLNSGKYESVAIVEG